jgi:hypothetical protein
MKNDYRAAKVELAQTKMPLGPEAWKLIGWYDRFLTHDVAPNYQGNNGGLSYRLDDGFVITNGSDNGLVRIVRGKGNKLEVHGNVIPLDIDMHNAIYRVRPDVAAIFPGYSEALLNMGPRMGAKHTSHEAPYGSYKLAMDITQLLDKQEYFLIIKGTGFLSLGLSMDMAGRLALTMHDVAKQISEPPRTK